MKKRTLCLILGGAQLSILSTAGQALAQTTDTGSSGAATGGSGAAAGGVSTGPTTITVTPPSVTYPTFPGGVAPTPPGQVLGGGNVQGSSSRPITGNETDGFDLLKQSGGGTVRGSENGAIFSTGSKLTGAVNVPATHVVRKGDTLWDICDTYFHDPYEWPRVWALNPGIKNPHWIEPGELVRLRADGEGRGPVASSQILGQKKLRQQEVDPKSIFLRDVSHLERDEDFDYGFIEGAREERMFLENDDEVYLRWKGSRDLVVGHEFSIFREVQKTKYGWLVEVQGSVRIDSVDTKTKIARARITETVSTIERGAHFGPVPRRFDVVAPTKNTADAKGTIFAAVQLGHLFGQHRAVYVDLGEGSGIKPGNTLTVVRKGDGLQRSVPSRSAVLRIETGGDRRDQELIVKPEQPDKLRDEKYATLRVLAVGKRTATCYVVESAQELEEGDRVILQKDD